MFATIFILAWAVVFFGVLAYAFQSSRTEGEKPAGPLGSLPAGVKALVGLAAVLAVIAIPAIVVASANDRVPSGAGTYTVDSSEHLREGRLLFRETCASCHTLSAANARGVYGPNLDNMGLDAKGSEDRVAAAIKNGGASSTLMPKGLLEGENAELVSEYVAAVAGK